MKIKTFKEWIEREVNFDTYVKPGDIVDEEMTNHFLIGDYVWEENYFRSGERFGYFFHPVFCFSSDTYDTFKNDGENWIYCGHCLDGETTHREPDRFAYDKEDWYEQELEDLQHDLEIRKDLDDPEFIKVMTDFYKWRVQNEGTANRFGGSDEE